MYVLLQEDAAVGIFQSCRHILPHPKLCHRQGLVTFAVFRVMLH